MTKTWSDFNSGTHNSPHWQSIETIDALLGGISGPLPVTLALPCWERLQALRKELAASWQGCQEIIDWLLATFLARENVLLIGPPGGAKSEIVTRLYALLGLATPSADFALIRKSLVEHADLLTWWDDRVRYERETPKQFHYLLQRFVQPEELFGPIEIELLRRGVLVRVNFGMLTGPGVFAAFLDEIFTASPNLLNVLLTLLSERKYFNWGGMVSGDLVVLAAASNELPGSGGLRGEEFRASWALLDRFAVRLRVDIASATSMPGLDGIAKSDLAQATRLALQREGNRFASGAPFSALKPAGLSDLLCLGRYACEHLAAGSAASCPFDGEALRAYDSLFFSIAASLQRESTRVRDAHVTWSISPRKLKALYKVGLAHALLRQEHFDASHTMIAPDKPDLLMFSLIWDSVEQQERLDKLVRSHLGI